MKMDEKILKAARVIWDYGFTQDPLEACDLMLVMGTHDIDVAHYAAEIAHQYEFKTIICTGGIAHQDDLLKTPWDGTEADMFATVLMEAGVPEEAIIKENKATNAGENFRFSRDILRTKGITPNKAFIVQKPYFLRRAYSTAMKEWPELDWKTTARPISMMDYLKTRDADQTINIMVGDCWRVKNYPALGLQIEQEFPQQVNQALDFLMDQGFVKHIPTIRDNLTKGRKNNVRN